MYEERTIIKCENAKQIKDVCTKLYTVLKYDGQDPSYQSFKNIIIFI